MDTRTLKPATPARRPVPSLENGDHLSAREFLRRYEAMPEVKKAELIQGIVHMASPVRLDLHGKPDALIQGWLCVYAASHPEATHATNVTVRLDSDDVAQPDAVLFLDAAQGGKAAVDESGYLSGAPELVVEIAASSVSRDAREKLVSYRRAGVAEYLLWRVLDEERSAERSADLGRKRVSCAAAFSPVSPSRSPPLSRVISRPCWAWVPEGERGRARQRPGSSESNALNPPRFGPAPRSSPVPPSGPACPVGRRR